MEPIVRRGRQGSQFLTTCREMLQRVVLDAGGKLITHLRRHERMGDVVLLEVVVQRNKIQTQLLGDDIHRSAAGQCGIHIHHAGVEAIAGVCRHPVLGLEFVVALIPVAEADEVAVRQLTALGHAGRAGGVEHDEEPVRL